MAYRRHTNTRNSVADAEGDLLNSGTIEIWTGPQVTAVGDTEVGTKLGTLTFAATAFGTPGTPTGGVTAGTITSDTDADDNGTAGHAVLKTSTPTVHSDATCGQGTGDFNFDNNIIVAGGTIAVSSLTLTSAI